MTVAERAPLILSYIGAGFFVAGTQDNLARIDGQHHFNGLRAITKLASDPGMPYAPQELTPNAASLLHELRGAIEALCAVDPAFAFLDSALWMKDGLIVFVHRWPLYRNVLAMTIAEQLAAVDTVQGLEAVLLEARRSPRTLSFNDINREQFQAKTRVQEEFGRDADEVLRTFSLSHRTLMGYAEQANLTTHPELALAVARISTGATVQHQPTEQQQRPSASEQNDLTYGTAAASWYRMMERQGKV